MHGKWDKGKYIGYFGVGTNTYADINVLKEKFELILKQDNVIGLSIATRPDSISEECLEYLSDLNKRCYLTVELGLQTIHEKTSNIINRCHSLECFVNAVNRLRKLDINVTVHIINGLPYETEEMMIDTVKFINTLDIQGIKIHMLHVIKGTILEELYQKEKFPLLTMKEYINIVCNQLEHLRPEIVIHRLTGDPEIKDLIEPIWTIKKIDVLNGIDKELASRESYQGIKYTEFE